MRYYTTCDEIPLFNFIKVLIGKDFRYLLKNRKKPSKKPPEPVWETLYEEYLTLSNNRTTAQLFSVLKEIYTLEIEIKIIYSCVDFLRQGYDEKVHAILTEKGFFGEFRGPSLESDLKKAIAGAKRLSIQFKQADREFQEMGEKQSEPTEKDFQTILVHLGKFAGYRLDSKQITVSEFIAYLDEHHNVNRSENPEVNE